MKDTLSINPANLPLAKLHGYLLAAVAPRPIAFASTIDSQGSVNLSPFSFFNAFSANPPILIFSPARRGRDNSTKDTYDNVKQVAEVTINIVNHDMAEQMSLASTEYDKGINEFIKAGLTPVESLCVKPPWVQESPVAFECKVNDIIELGSDGGAGNLVISEVLYVHLNKQYLRQDDSLDPTKIDQIGRMGENWYCRASGDAMFEIPKPLLSKGIGVDQLPESIRNSDILTGNNLGRIGNVEKLPSGDNVQRIAESEPMKSLLEANSKNSNELKRQLHLKGKLLIERGNIHEALATLMIVDYL
ncbi:MAG: flavin reductase family protein [Cyclobacteriaceae bacterium]